MEFHIHINADYLTDEIKRFFFDRKFYSQPFLDAQEQQGVFKVDYHLTKKFYSSLLFKEEFNIIEEYPNLAKNIHGYIEGEFVSKNITIPYKSFLAKHIKIPFKVSKLPADPGTFRESEIHVSARVEQSSKKVMDAFTMMGFESITLIKKDCEYVVFSLQGDEYLIEKIVKLTLDFLDCYGGLYDCKVKEEKTARWWLSNKSINQPAKVNKIEFYPVE